jgi:hypothetical protein
MKLFVSGSRCFTHRESRSIIARFTPIETKSVSDADCMTLLTPYPVVVLERFRDVACMDLEESMPKVTSLFLANLYSPELQKCYILYQRENI